MRSPRRAGRKELIRVCRLRTGATIHTVSALILQLVQTSPPDLREQVRAKLATGAATGEKLVDVEMRDSQDEVDEEVEELEVLPPLVRSPSLADGRAR